MCTSVSHLIDCQTPQSVYTRVGQDGRDYKLVFSDEFNQDGRTFKDGDDPFWTAADMHYWSTGDMEYYSPAQVTTKDGYLALELKEAPDPAANHGFKYVSGMLTTWNKYVYENKQSYLAYNPSNNAQTQTDSVSQEVSLRQLYPCQARTM